MDWLVCFGNFHISYRGFNGSKSQLLDSHQLVRLIHGEIKVSSDLKISPLELLPTR